jgi:hypothetical protein
MSIYQTYTPPSQSGGFLKMTDGQTLTLRIASEPVIFNNEFKGKTSTRYAWIVYNHDENVAQIFQNSARFFNNLAAYAKDEEYGDPTQYNIKVTRKGSDTNTEYTVVTSPKKYPLPQEAKDAVADVDIIEAIKAGQGTSNVFWLSDFAKCKTEELPVTQVKEEFDIGPGEPDDEIDLSEIPF